MISINELIYLTPRICLDSYLAYFLKRYFYHQPRFGYESKSEYCHSFPTAIV